MFLLIPAILSHSIVKRQDGDTDKFPAIREVKPNIYSFTSNGFIISLIMVTDEGVMVIDPMDVDHSEAMLAEIRKITEAPIKYVFYSHNHYDHVKGGQIWKDEGATLVSHIEAYDYIKENPSQDLVLPDETWSGDRKDYTLGDIKVELHFLGLSHGNGMTTFVLPNQKVATTLSKGCINNFFSRWVIWLMW